MRLNEKLAENQALREKANRFDQLASVLNGIMTGKELVCEKNTVAREEDSDSGVEPVKKIDLDHLQNAFRELSDNCAELVRVLTSFVDER